MSCGGVSVLCVSVCISVCLRTETVTEMDAAFTRESFADAPYFSPCQVRRERTEESKAGLKKGGGTVIGSMFSEGFPAPA